MKLAKDCVRAKMAIIAALLLSCCYSGRCGLSALSPEHQRSESGVRAFVTSVATFVEDVTAAGAYAATFAFFCFGVYRGPPSIRKKSGYSTRLFDHTAVWKKALVLPRVKSYLITPLDKTIHRTLEWLCRLSTQEFKLEVRRWKVEGMLGNQPTTSM